MKLLHCDICEVLMGVKSKDHTIWCTVESPKIQLDVCQNCIESVEKGIRAIIHNLREEKQKKVKRHT